MVDAAAASVPSNGNGKGTPRSKVSFDAKDPSSMPVVYEHSRTASYKDGSSSNNDRDRSWEPNDNLNARKVGAQVRRENTRILEARGRAAADQTQAPRDKGSPRGSSKSTPRQQSSMCTIS